MHYADFRQIWVHEPEERPLGDPNAYSCVIAVGYLLGFVVSWLDAEPSMAGVLPRFERARVQVWPLSEGTSTWPPAISSSGPWKIGSRTAVLGPIPAKTVGRCGTLRPLI